MIAMSCTKQLCINFQLPCVWSLELTDATFAKEMRPLAWSLGLALAPERISYNCGLQ
jgi:hypothetical protein